MKKTLKLVLIFLAAALIGIIAYAGMNFQNAMKYYEPKNPEVTEQ